MNQLQSILNFFILQVYVIQDMVLTQTPLLVYSAQLVTTRLILAIPPA